MNFLILRTDLKKGENPPRGPLEPGLSKQINPFRINLLYRVQQVNSAYSLSFYTIPPTYANCLLLASISLNY